MVKGVKFKVAAKKWLWSYVDSETFSNDSGQFGAKSERKTQISMVKRGEIQGGSQETTVIVR